MEFQPLMVFAIKPEAVPLLHLQNAIDAEGYPMSFGISIAGDAEGDALVGAEWDAIFVRWKEPEVHEVAVLERGTILDDEEAQEILAVAQQMIAGSDDEVGITIVADHLSKTQCIYALELMPALLDNDEHQAWEGLDTLLRSLAEYSDGLVYAQGEGFCAADGELLLLEPANDEEYYETTTGRNGTHEHPTESPRY